MAFPDDPLEHRTQFAFGADLTADPGTWVWADATPALLEQQISITRGRQAESGGVTPGSISAVLDNPSGDWTPELATGAHYPHIVPGVPMRESLRGGTTFIELPGAGARVSTPTDVALQFTGDFDIRADLTLTQWRLPGHQVALASKAGSGTDQSWEIGITGEGRLYVVWRELVDSWVELWPEPLIVVPPSGRLAVRVAVDVDNGAGGLTSYFWTAPTLAGPWTALGDPVPLDGASALWPSSAPVEVGDLTHPMLSATVPPVGRLHGLEVREGIDGTVRAQVTAADVTEDAATFTQGGRTWTVTAPAAATRWVPRITAAVTSWAPEWPSGDLSDSDTGEPGEAQVTVQASGLLQRLGTGQPALASTLRRRIPAAPAADRLLAYWPCEDGTSATQAASGLPGGTPLRLTGVTWAEDDSLPGSSPLPTTGTSASLGATVPAPTGAAPTGWHLEFVYRVDTGPATASQVLNLKCAAGRFSDIRISLTGSLFTITFVYEDGTADTVGTVPTSNAIGTWNRLVLYADQTTSTTMNIHFGVTTIGGTVYGVDSGSVTGKIGRITNLNAAYGSAIQGMRIGHIGVFAAAKTDVYNSADTGFDGELAAERIIRLCGEENIPLLAVGDIAATAPMGPQGTQTLLDLLQEAADTDGGVLTEQRDRLGVRYRTLRSFYNQQPALTLDARAGEIANPFLPTSSDESLHNQITAERTGGSSAIVADKVSIARSGIRPDQATVNPQSDDQLANIASWLLRLGTAPGMRYPQLTMDLAIALQLADAWLQVDSGDLLEVVRLPPQHPSDTVRALIQGYTETYSSNSWTVTANATPGAPWGVGQLGSTPKPRAGTAGCTLGADIDADDTALTLVTSRGPRWADSSTYPTDFPFDLLIGGERVTCTAITGTTTTQTATVTRAVNGVVRGWGAGTKVTLADRTYTAR